MSTFAAQVQPLLNGRPLAAEQQAILRQLVLALRAAHGAAPAMAAGRLQAAMSQSILAGRTVPSGGADGLRRSLMTGSLRAVNVPSPKRRRWSGRSG